MKKNKVYGHGSWRDHECLKVNWLVEVHFSAVRNIKKHNRLSYTFLATASSSAPSPITTYTALRPNLWETRSKQLSLPVKRSKIRIYIQDNIRYILLGNKLKVPHTGSLMLFLQKERIITQKHFLKRHLLIIKYLSLHRFKCLTQDFSFVTVKSIVSVMFLHQTSVCWILNRDWLQHYLWCHK